MVKVFAEQKGMTACMFLCLVLSIFFRIFLGAMYNHMIKEAENMATTNNKLLKQCKIKFSNCYEMNNGISNIPIFVDKFISRLALGPLSFGAMYHLAGQLMLLSVVFSGLGVCRSIMRGDTLGEILPFYIVSLAGLYLYFSVSTVVDIKEKRKVLKVNLVDYLENHLSPRIHVTRRDMEMLYGDATYIETSGKKRKSVELMPIGNRETAPEKTEEQPDSSAVTEEELEALLKEFLTG